MKKMTVEQAKDQFNKEFELSQEYLEGCSSEDYAEIQAMFVSWLRCLDRNGLLEES